MKHVRLTPAQVKHDEEEAARMLDRLYKDAYSDTEKHGYGRKASFPRR